MWRRLLLGILGLPALATAQLKFVENKGQWATGIEFLAKVPGGSVGVTPTGFKVKIIDQHALDNTHSQGHLPINESSGNPAEAAVDGHYFQIDFLGANAQKPLPSGQLEGFYNYYVGNARNWATAVPAYESIRYPEIYPGIELEVASNGNNLKYNFIVDAEANPSHIQIDYCGVLGIKKESGNLMLETSLGTLTELKPVSYQHINGVRVDIPTEFILEGNTVGFGFPEGYDPCYEIVIDPILIFSTYSGSTADNWGSTATPGEHGTVYSSGTTNSQSGGVFPATPGAFQLSLAGSFDIAIIKYDSIGSKFLYATYLGGTGNDQPVSLVVDSASQDLLMLGLSSSVDYPTSNNAFDNSFNGGSLIFNRVLFTDDRWDIVVTRLNKEGTQLVGSTYLGGSGNDGLNFPKQNGGPLVANYGDEMRGDIITDKQGNVFLASVSSSLFSFPVMNSFGTIYYGGGSDAVVLKLLPDLSGVAWGTFIGGVGYDAAYSIKFDSHDNIVVAGGTTSVNFPTSLNAYQTTYSGGVDGWVAILAADGSQILHSTLTGTPQFDQVYFVDLNSKNEVFCYGQTTGPIPVTAGAFNQPKSGQFLQKFSADLSSLGFSTVFGSGPTNTNQTIPNISPTAFLVNECDNIFMSGWGGLTNSNSGYWQSNTQNMPISPDAHQKNTSGSDFYFLVLNGSATEMVYATYLGGNSSRTHVDGGTSRFDKFGIVYHSVCAGCVSGNAQGKSTSDFPSTPGAHSRSNASTNCNNAAFKFDLSSLRAKFQTNNVAFTIPNFDRVCYPDTIRFQNLSIGGEIYEWDFGDGRIVTKPKKDTASLLHQYQAEGVYTVKLKAIDDNTCSQVDITSKTVHYFKDEIEIGDGATICEGIAVTLQASGGVQYEWSTSEGFQSNEPNPSVKPTDTTLYKISVVDSDGCTKEDTVQLNVIPKVNLKWKHAIIIDCVNKPTLILENTSIPAADVEFAFDLGDGNINSNAILEHQYAKDSVYTVKLVANRVFCAFKDSVKLPMYTLFVPNAITPGLDGKNDVFKVKIGENFTVQDIGLKASLAVFNRWGNLVFSDEDYRNTWRGTDVESGVYYYELKIAQFATCKSWVHVVKE